ncbi:hypothetical protein PCC8801_2737 [Rippkaea orientalis PCC 8801]|uniref:Uncharacterized protein n=1 Tax=Rippkaea orientalis (strain PCC 8801 / RF-1) TaxID=41431 RepID=B7K5K5_RIPO1|nr:hypothetical protein [Rippkaea orientalis]ACK66738.1 hypothetical protein PCC8801_2737 [Rippkaea orientalis PCC 8801]
MVSSATMEGFLTANPGDRISSEPQTIEEKAKQIAVDKYDITGEHIQVPTYFIVNYPNGETKALHHVRDAKAISDVIRQMRLEEETTTTQTSSSPKNINGLIIILGLAIVGLFLMTLIISIGVF